MPFRPKDQIDMMLINKYVNERADNDNLVSLINPAEMMSAMKDYAEIQRNFANMNAKLRNLCQSVNSKAAKYRGVTMPMAQPQA